MKKTDKVGIIGGGLGGLAAACTLAARGYSVILFEQNPWLGGKAAVLQDQGFRFDMGPTILTLPSILARIFAETGRELHQALDLIPLDPQWRSFFTDGSTLDLCADVDRMMTALEAFAPEAQDSEGYRHFLEFARKLHDISNRYFFWRPIDSLWDTFDARSTFQLSVLSDLLAMRPGQTVAGAIRTYLHDPRVTQMMDHFTQYVGSAPDASPAILCSIAHMQIDEGVWYPRGGTGTIPKALADLAIELGVEMRTRTTVRRILLAHDTVMGVETTSGERIPLTALVSNADAVRTYRELIGGQPGQQFENRRHYEPACSGVVLYLGLKRAYDHLLHHNFVFSHDPEEEFEAIYRYGKPAPDPTCYVCAPARTDPAVAPNGGEALYILVHTPYLRPGQDWKRFLPAYRQTILNKLAQTAGLTDLQQRIVVEHTLTPEDIHQRYRVLNGAIYGLASHGRFLGAFKPGNRSSGIKGLYLAGGAAHPGPGMPMVLMSGWIAADTLDRDNLVQPHLPSRKESYTMSVDRATIRQANGEKG